MSIKNKIRNTIIALSLIAVMGVIPVTASAITLAELVELFIALEIIPADKAESARSVLSQDTPTVDSCSYNWTRNLSKGSTGEDVKNLQIFLNKTSDTELASFGVGSKDNETNYFGLITANAVARFQDKYASDILTPLGLTKGTGYFGASTQAKVNALCVPEPVVVVPPIVGTPTFTGLEVSSIDQPTNILAPEGAARIEFTRITLKAGDEDVTVKGVIVERTGFSSNAPFSSIFLMYEDGTLIGTGKLLNSHNQATVGTSFVIPAGTTKTVVIGANMKADLTSSAGEMPILSVIGVNTNSSVTGDFPIDGATHTVNSTLAIGSVVVSEGRDNPSADETISIGSEDVVFSSLKIKNTSSSEDISVNGIRFYNAGTIAVEDLIAVVRVNDGYPIAVVNEGRYFSVTFPAGVTIQRGKYKTFELSGDIAYSGNAVGRVIRFEIDRPYDINVSGNNFGYGILPTIGDFAEDIEIITGNIESFSRNNAVTAENIIIGQSEQVLGGFKIELEGEGIHVNTLKFNVVTTGSADASDLKDVQLLDEDGVTLAGPVDGSDSTITFNDVEFPIGVTSFTLLGELTLTFEDGDTVKLNTDPSSALWSGVRGIVTDNAITLAGTSKTSATQTASNGGELTITEDSTSPKATLFKGGERVTLGVFKFTTEDAEDVELKEITLTSVTEAISFYEIYNASGGGVLNYSTDEDGDNTTFTFDNLVLAKDNDTKLIVKAVLTDIDGTAVSNGDTLTVTLTSYEAEGVVSEKELIETVDVETATHTLYEAFPELSWENAGDNITLFPQARTPIDTIFISNNGNEDITLGTITLDFLGDYASLGDVVLEDRNGDILATEAGDTSVTFTIDLDVPRNGFEEIKVYADTIAFDADSILQVMLEDVSGSVVFSIDGIGTYSHDEILPSGNIYSQSLSR